MESCRKPNQGVSDPPIWATDVFFLLWVYLLTPNYVTAQRYSLFPSKVFPSKSTNSSTIRLVGERWILIAHKIFLTKFLEISFTCSDLARILVHNNERYIISQVLAYISNRKNAVGG